MNEPVYPGLVILDLSKIVMYEFHYYYIKPKYEEALSADDKIIQDVNQTRVYGT